MAEIRDVRTRFIKEGRCEEGIVVGCERDKDKVRISSEIVSVGKGYGDLELLAIGEKGQEALIENPVLYEHSAVGSHRICEYELPHSKALDDVTDLWIEKQLDTQGKIPINEGLHRTLEKERDRVHREIEGIKACRTSLFMGTLGILGAAGIAILGFIGTRGEATPLFDWLPWAAAIPVLLLTTSIITLIHKARRINERIGYLEAVEGLKSNSSLEKFRGWILSNSTNRKCNILRHAKKTGDKCPSRDQILCTIEGRSKAYDEINKHVKLLPHMLNSFTSLCTYVYSVAYVMAVGAFLFSTIGSIKIYVSKKYPAEGISDKIFWGAVAIGVIITALISARTFKKKLKSPDKTRVEYFLQYIGSLSPVIMLLLVTGLIVSLKQENQT